MTNAITLHSQRPDRFVLRLGQLELLDFAVLREERKQFVSFCGIGEILHQNDFIASLNRLSTRNSLEFDKKMKE